MDLSGLDWVGVYGAILATILGIYELNKSRQRLFGGLSQYRFFDLSTSTQKYFFDLSFANKSHRPVQIDSIHILCGKEDYTLTAEAFNDPKQTMPIYLHESEGKTFSLNIPHLVSWFKFRYPYDEVVLRVLLITSDGKHWKSKPSIFDIAFYSRVFKDKLINLRDPRKDQLSEIGK
jgi:hypothetical protein